MSVGRTDSGGTGDVLNVTVVKDDGGYGMTVSGNDPVVVQSVVKGGAAWRAGVRTGDRIISVNNVSVETSVHNHVVTMIRASPVAHLLLLRQNNISITAPLPVGREGQRQVEFTKVQTLHLMLENENRYIENLRSSLARDRNERKSADLLAAQGRREKLLQQATMMMQNLPVHQKEQKLNAQDSDQIPSATPPKQGFLSHLPRSLSSLTGQSLRGLKHAQSQHQQQNPYQTSPVTCLDGATINTNSPPPLPPRLSPATAAPPLPPPSPGARPTAPFPPNSMAAQMNYPLVAVTHPPIQGSGMGHHRSKSSPEELNKMNNSNDDNKDSEWETVSTPPGTPPPPYPIAPQPQLALDPQRAIISMEEDDTPTTLTRSMLTSSGGFSTSIESLSIARQAIFLNWLVGEQRPPQAALLYLLAGAYAVGPPAALARWAYEIHSVFLVPGAPLALSNVDENLAREIDDALIEHDKEEALRKIFLNAREKAKEELSQQLIDFQKKRQSGLSGFYGPSDSVLDACDSDKSQEASVVMTWLLPRLANWVEMAATDTWSATKGSPSQALLAATVPPLLHHTFGLKPQAVSIAMGSGLPGAAPRPSFLQRDKLYKQRIKHLNKTIAHPLVIRGHHFSPLTVTSVCDCQHCHLLIWGIAPQAYHCSDCKLRVHRSCSRQVEESCCGPAAAQTRISRLMEKLTPAPLPMGNSHQHVDNNQHHHEKKQRKSLGTSHFLNMERSSRKNEDDSSSCLDNSASSHHSFSDRSHDSRASSVRAKIEFKCRQSRVRRVKQGSPHLTWVTGKQGRYRMQRIANNSQNAPANPVDNKSKMKRKKVLVVKSSRSKEEMLKGKKQEEDKQDIVKQESIEPENLKQEQEAKEEETSVDVTDNTNGSMPLIPDNESGQTPDKEADPPEDTVVNIPEVLEEIAQEEHVEEKAALNESEEEKKDVFVEKVSDVLSDSECEQDRKKPKTKHRKTMSMSNTIELVKNMGDEWIEAAKREFEEHSKKKENKKESKDHGSHQSLDKKKDYSDKGSDCSKSLCDFRDSGGVVILLSDATVGETDDFETVEESDFSSKKHQKKKESKSLKEPKGSSKTSQIMSAQKMNVKKIAKASSAGALSFIRKRKSHGNSNAAPGSINQRDSVDYATLSTALFIDSERTHTEMVEDVKVLLKNRLKNVVNTVEDEKVVKPAVESPDVSDEDAEEIFYDAKNDLESSEETRGVMLPPKNLLPKLAEAQRSGKMSSQRSRKTLGGSLKRTGGKRKVRRRSTADEAIPPPLPPRVILAHPPPKHGSHWLFGNSFKGDGRRDDDSGADGVSHLTDSSHFNSDHASDRTDTSWRGGSNLTSKPVTRAESYRDRADRVKRTKRKTSDPNQLTSAKDYHDAEAVGGGPALPGGPSGGSSNSSLSSKSNDSSHIENHGSQSEWSDEEEDSSMPWSALAPPELVATMSALARKRQDLIHELISSEASHVRWLRVLRRVFLTPLQRSGGSLLPSNELKNLFPNLPDVLQRHKRLALDLRNLKANAATVKTKPLAEALVNTLGEARYAGALAKFCGGQGLALETLRERRRRNKELNAFLARSEQDPLCARLRLQDLLACVWQRLTKYQLLLEGIVKTAGAEEDLDSQALEDEDFARVAHALHLAKDVLHTVNTAIKTTENDHRLKSIQSKLEVRGGGDVEIYEEIRKIDLTKHSLIMEGTLNIRQEYNKRVNVLALLLRECLVLLHTDGEKYVLRPVPQTNTPFSPVVKWNTALFRPNAAVKNSFFLVNLENMHMYELCATTPSEYNTWVKHLREAAKALEGKGGTTDEGPPPPLPSAPPPVSVTTTVESASNGNNTPEASSAPTDEGNPKPKPCSNEDDGNQVSGALQSVVGEEEAGLANNEGKRCSKLLAPEEISVAVPPTTMTAHIQLTPEERLRRAEEKVTMALSEAAEAVKLVTGSQRIHLKASTEQLVGKEFNQQEDLDQEEASMSTEQLVMIAQSHVNSLTEVLLRALRVSSSDCSMTKCEIRPDFGLCDSCSYHLSKYSTLRSMKQTNGNNKSFDSGDVDQKQDGDLELRWRDSRTIDDAEQRVDSIIVENIGESSTDPVNDMESTKVSASGLGLRRTLSILERRLVSSEREREVLRARLQQADNRIHRMHQLHKDCLHNEQPVKQEVCQQAITANSTDQSGGEG